MKFGEFLGNFQMVVLLSVIYWSLLALMAIPFRLIADPLSLRQGRTNHWIRRGPQTDALDSMKKQG